MGRKSTIDMLPTDVRDQLIAWIEDPAIDISTAHERVTELLKELGLEDKVSRSAVGRAAKSHKEEMQRIGEHMREAKASSTAFYEQFGDDLGDGGKFLAETMQAYILKLNMALYKLDEEEMDAGDVFLYSKIVKNLTGSISQLEEALSKYTKREAEIKKAATEAAAETAEAAAGAAGLSAEKAAAIKAQILGIG